ncbi:alpha-sarcoglycan [Pectinophora gossypiella]|uniref:alpha-sarcoglycan n=1 Tax=Pectinophora gossypiella TaxID=13191 RepID=UPI00214F2BF2|nr:alpha-sarcoglycan [Pectinophora gossypiella]XP_049880684.1 alpha-sarcoglycan [Pectinophora gossypiella]XP_049880685.1 alpha-sarcoglycan [Pectinophora gossypiella]XP_049880686.1 alpha-sarcoglycan [Pectinophora gossypiella]XP_049880687.1 alpha-sarcoglycan [Pectinophora gossypiella]XP_049880688.1 alpha-sarcoglycan [Pectinophora gossypiella]XP_049880690.1 alpha-sarcoglycan [Pectinophora gossypiella]XP_049880691.1 alpha-sarcoglycan [Pectinophora gossypiella]XP_049880692.1 alpha-sarcoglycan [P
MELKIFIIPVLFGIAAATHVHEAVETEMFAIPISPNLFNWTYQEFDQQYRFHASMLGKPELPSWLRYIYSRRHHAGFIFGTPPRGVKSPITLEVIGLNSADYETRRVLLTLQVRAKENMARHELELKIDNLNVEDLCDQHKMNRLKDIFRMKLWTESSQDLYATFLASAIDLGARLPLRPSDGEGLVVRLGSAQPFSSELKRLREEVRPLSRLPSCPREYKRTTVERLFRDAEFIVDWCRFELYNTIYKERSTEHLEYLTEIPNSSKKAKSYKGLDTHMWSAPSIVGLPSRSYSKQLMATVAVPLLLLLLAVVATTAVLCFHYAAMRDRVSENFLDDIFHICIDYRRRRAHKSAKVELCRYGTANTEQTQVGDNTSNKSLGVSPNNSLVRPYSPKSSTNLAGSYNRPQPPPYAGSTLHHRRSTAEKTPSTRGHTPEHRNHLVLEESLKLLNEANINSEFDPILKDPIVDMADGVDDYVPIKPDSTGYISMKADLDDIDVPELSKYGLGGVAI